MNVSDDTRTGALEKPGLPCGNRFMDISTNETIRAARDIKNYGIEKISRRENSCNEIRRMMMDTYKLVRCYGGDMAISWDKCH